MMTLEDYALDVNRSVEDIMALCDKLDIKYTDENSLLNETDIILLDNEQQDSEDYITTGDEDALEEQRLEEEVEDIAEELALNTKFDLENSQSFEKVKPKAVKKTENNKKDFLKERKKMYKNREKLQSNEQVQDENVILYKEGMTVSEFSTALGSSVGEVIKKLMKEKGVSFKVAKEMASACTIPNIPIFLLLTVHTKTTPTRMWRFISGTPSAKKDS